MTVVDFEVKNLKVIEAAWERQVVSIISPPNRNLAHDTHEGMNVSAGLEAKLCRGS